MLKNGQYFVQKNKERIKITYFVAVATHSMAFIHTLALKYSYIEDLFSIQIPSQSPRIHVASESSITSNASICGNAPIKGWCSIELSTKSSPPSISKKSF